MAYWTTADNLSSLVSGSQDKYYSQVYVTNQTSGATSLVSQTSNGLVGNGYSDNERISSDGNTITFISNATNFVSGVPLASGTSFGVEEIYQKNLTTGALTLVSKTANGVVGDGVENFDLSVSADGNEVAFLARGNLTNGGNGSQDIVVKNVATGSLTTINTGMSSTAIADISPDGKFVIWDGNGETDINGNNLSYEYITNIATGATAKLSQVNGTSFRDNDTTSYGYDLSANDQIAAFTTAASNPSVQNPTVFPNTISDLDVVSATIPLTFTSNAADFGTTTSSINSPGGEVYALYEGLLGRAPDALGAENWVATLKAGTPLDQVAQAFLNSPEGQQTFPTSGSNTMFVDQLYESVLGRQADAGGQQTWVTVLNEGGSRADVADDFVFSQEHISDLQPALTAGIFVADVNTSAVARLYYGLLGRAPDAGGLQANTQALDSGVSIQTLAQSFINSSEYESHDAGVSNSAFVTDLYQNARSCPRRWCS